MEAILIIVLTVLIISGIIFISLIELKKVNNKYADTYDLFKYYQNKYRITRAQLVEYYKLFLGKGDTILVEWENGNKTYEKVISVNPDANFIKLDESIHGSHWCKYIWIKEIITARDK
ncbi:MAG: hypothetical protein ACOCVF_02250 [bacterium]